MLEGIVIGALPVLLIVILLLVQRIESVNKALERFQKDTEHHLKEVDYAFLSVAKSLEAMSDAMIAAANPSRVDDVLKEKIGKIKSSTEKFMKINEITKEQLSLFSSTQSPSASASHSRHKNQIVGRLKELEKEKRTIMQSILDDGIDPEITVLDEEGKTKTMKMSEAMNLTPLDDKPTDQKTPRKKEGNVVSLFSKGDNDDDDNPGDKTLH